MGFRATSATEPEVNIRAAVSPTMRPMPRMMPERMPGMALGRMMRNTVRSRPAPRPNEPSRKESGTEMSASSVVRMMSGKIMMATVNTPASSEYPQCSAVTKHR